MGVNAGRLKHRVTICRYQAVDDGLNGTVNKLVPFRTVYAEMRPMRGREYLEYYNEGHDLIYKCTIRYRKDLRATDVVVFRDRQFRITSIINVMECGEYMEIMCTEDIEKRRPEVRENVGGV